MLFPRTHFSVWGTEMLCTYICILACFNHFPGIYNGNETINIAHWNMKPGFAYKCPHPCTATERHSPSILLLKNELWALIHKSSSKPCTDLQLCASTSRVLGSHGNHSLASLSKGTKQFCYSEGWPQLSSEKTANFPGPCRVGDAGHCHLS